MFTHGTKPTIALRPGPPEVPEYQKLRPIADSGPIKAPFSISKAVIYQGLAAVFFSVVVASLADRNAPEFGRHPDEAAHFITGTLIHDWAAAGFPRPAVDYGMRYYSRFPKVAFGHWPPVFYGVQGAWYGLFGVSRGSATALISAIAVVFLLILFEFFRSRTSAPAAFLAVALVVGSSVFQYVSSVFMADLLVALLSVSALWCFTVYLDRGGLVPILGFGVFSALAILTKQDAIVLAVVPPLSLIARRRWELLKDWKFYLPALVVLALCLPYYWLVLGLEHSPWEGMARRSLSQKAEFLAKGLSLCGPAGLVITLFGTYAATMAAHGSNRTANALAVLTAHAFGVVAVQMATPVSFDPRYRTALIPITAFLAANAFQTVFAWQRGQPVLKFAALGLLAVGLIFTSPSNAARKVSGYRQAVGALSEQRTGLQIVMVCSDPQGDGAVTAEFRLQHPSGRFVLIRADKMLATSTWMNQNYKLFYQTPEAVENYLLTQHVHYVLIDDWGKQSGRHHDLLEDLLENDPDRFPLVDSFKVERLQAGFNSSGRARLYRVEHNAGKFPSEVELTVKGLPRGGKIKASVGDF